MTEAERCLTLRQAIFVYEAARLAAIAAEAPIIPEPWNARGEDFRQKFLDVIAEQTGPHYELNPEKLHRQWVKAYEEMGWKYGPERDHGLKTHPDMVPWEELHQLERDKDEVFVALCQIARLFIRE